MRRLIPLLLLLALAPASAASHPERDPVDEALALAMAHHPELVAREAEYRAIRSTSRWKTDFTLSLSEGRTEFGASGGGRAMMSVSIPLTGGTHDQRNAAALRELETARDTLRQSLLADITALREAASLIESREERRDFWRDQVTYHQEAVDEGFMEPERLWGPAERLQAAEHDYREKAANLDARMEEVARRYGGRQWEALRDLLAEIVS